MHVRVYWYRDTDAIFRYIDKYRTSLVIGTIANYMLIWTEPSNL